MNFNMLLSYFTDFRFILLVLLGSQYWDYLLEQYLDYL